ncbi:MAG: NTP transferase domain-containing protein [Gaiellaceae bacterium]
MASIVVPFRSPDAKRRLTPLGKGLRARVSLAMLGDVLAAAGAVGPTTLVTSVDAAGARAIAEELGTAVVLDPGGGQGAAVEAALPACHGSVLIVNADVPSARPRDLLALLGALPPGGLALAAARDGTTNALALASPRLFQPLYGPGSAERFLRHARGLGLPAAAPSIPALEDDVDTLADLERLAGALGPRSRAVLADLRLAAAS